MSKCITTYSGSEKNGNVMVTIINYLSKKGLTPDQLAGVMGNIGFDSNGYQTNIDKTENGVKKSGICLWTDKKREELMNSAKTNNKDWTDITFQLDFLWTELTSDASLKKKIIDWFSGHTNATVKECVKKWQEQYKKCTPRQCNKTEREKYANEALSFYNKYASGECSTDTPPASNDNKSNVDGEGTAGSNIGSGSNSGTEVDSTSSNNPCNITVNAQAQNSGDSTSAGDANVTLETNTTDYKGKTLELLLEREDFTCVRTIGKLYDITEGKKQFICYIIEDRVRYTPDGKCCKAKHSQSSIVNGEWVIGANSSTAIPYGNYKIKLSKNSEAKAGKHYFYGAEHKNEKYKGYMAQFNSVIGKRDECKFTGVLIHASPDTNRGDQNDSGGCLVTGLKNNNSYLSQTIEGFHRLYDDYLIPATEAGSNIKLDIPRLYPEKDNKCYLSTNDMGQLISGDDILGECAKYKT